MLTTLPPLRLSNLRLLRTVLRPCEEIQPSQRTIRPPCRLRYASPRWTVYRGVKTVSRRKLKDLEQGAIKVDPLPTQEPDDAPQYPAVLQGVRNNMIKFENCVVLTRVGNFYELYFEHASEYGPQLGIKVSSRKTTIGPVPMAGFPIWQLDRFLKILVGDLNKYVAISEEFPTTASDKVKSGGLLFDRRVARVVTPGTLIDETFLDPHQNNFLLSIQMGNSTATDQNEIGLAWLDLSTGDFFTQPTTRALLPSALMRIGAREILLSSDTATSDREELGLIVGHAHDTITAYEASTNFASMSQWNKMLESPVDNDADSAFTASEKLAGHRLLHYVTTRLQGQSFQLQPPRRRESKETLLIDRSSLRGLELLETARDGFGKGSLYHAVRRTVTNSGSRLLRDRLTSPSASITEINSRLDLVTRFRLSSELRETIIFHLRRTFDVQRLVQKFMLNKGDADDMLCIARAITEMSEICTLLKADVGPAAQSEERIPHPFGSLLSRFSLQGPKELEEKIFAAIDEEGLSLKHRMEDNENADIALLAQETVLSTAPEEFATLPKAVRAKGRNTSLKDQDIDVEEPWIMRRNASNALYKLHDTLDALKEEKKNLAVRLREELSAPSLTLKSVPGNGHICHIRSANGFSRDKLEAMSARMVSSSKSTRSFHLADWTKLGSRMDQARLHIRNEEQHVFNSLRQLVVKNLVHLRRNASIVDELDVATAFAGLAEEQDWTRPILNESISHKIIGGRHPSVKLGLEEQGRSFVKNDLFLGDKERVWIVTGPNMAGKSTFLRQNALITILAQVGSYVPAEYAEIGLVDQIFSRIGSADDLFRDQSTFMVEMLETAAILKHATPRSFVIMDEVGRGTTPEDGTAVGFASLHHLYHTNKCRTLFATHFHPLVDMSAEWDCVGRYCTDVVEDKSGSFSFIHKLRPGVNRNSHALKVAKMAGVPDSALDVARQVLQRMQFEDGISKRYLRHDSEDNRLSATG